MRTATGNDSGTLNWRAWDVKDLAGERAHIEIVDRATGGWGHVLADHFVLSDIAAKIRSDETAVNLLVDGQVMRSTAGKESEALDWTSWDVSDLKGKDAQIQIVDRNSGGWGHVLADQFMFADAPAQSAEQRSELGGLRQGLLRRGHLQRRARRAPHRDRLDEQLELRRRHPDRPVAQRDERAA